MITVSRISTDEQTATQRQSNKKSAGQPVTLTSRWLGLLLLLLHCGLGKEEGRGLPAEEPLIVLDEDLEDGGNLLGVALLHHVGGIRGPEDRGAHTDGQVGAGHHVLLKRPCNTFTFNKITSS
jgi:hypothetical protein